MQKGTPLGTHMHNHMNMNMIMEGSHMHKCGRDVPYMTSRPCHRTRIALG